MAELIRVLHFADIHVGMENYGKLDPGTGISSRVMDFIERMSQIVAFAEENDADLAIFAGDAFKTPQPNPTHQREFARRIKRLSRQCPVVLLPGNHDIPSMVQKAASLDIFQALEVENVLVGRTPKLHMVETRRGPVQVATVPYPVKQRLLTDLPTRSLNLEQIDGLMRQQFDDLLRDLASQVQPDLPAVLVGHFTVMGARLGSERGIMIGRDVPALAGTLANPAWDYVALGHIHYHQNLNPANDPPIVYSGSVERIDFGEEDAPKGFCWVELQRKATNWQFVELPVRPFITIRVDARSHPDPTAAALDKISKVDVRDAVVRVLITATPENEPLLRTRDIERALEDAAFVAAIQREVEHPIRARLGTARVEGLSPVELLERFLMSKGVQPERIEHLRQAAEPIFAAEEQIGLS